MEQQWVHVSKSTIFSILKECTRKKDLGGSKKARCLMTQHGLDSSAFLADYLLRIFASSGSLLEANEVFNKVLEPTVYTWSAIISANAKLGEAGKALDLYKTMQLSCSESDKYIYNACLNACSVATVLEQGRLLHDQIIGNALESAVSISNTLIDMYGKCGSLEEACKVFESLQNKDVVSCNAMISAYIQHGHCVSALRLFENMQPEGLHPDKETFSSILKACCAVGAIEQGKLIHGCICRGSLKEDLVIGSTLVDIYAKWGRLEDALEVFNMLQSQDVVLWSVMIDGYVLHGHGLLALELFQKMQQQGIKPDRVAFMNVLKACAYLGAIQQARLVHQQVVKCGFEFDVGTRSSIIDTYAKCGYIEDAAKILNQLPKHDVSSWSAMIAGHAQNGNVILAEQCLEKMQKQGIRPDHVVFLSLLAACSHAGLIWKGCEYLRLMREKFNMLPTVSHYNCVVDLLGRAGYLSEANKLLTHFQPNFFGWMSLLAACRIYGNIELGKKCFEQLVSLDHQHAAGYILMSNIYADSHMQGDAEKVDNLRRSSCAWKKPGKAWIEVNNEVHEFIVGDRRHKQSNEIYSMLRMLNKQMKEEGYSPHLDLVLGAMSDEDKENALYGHCEKLAIAFGLISTPQGTTIRASKNLRVCADCHSAAKVISKIKRREIILKDAYRIHQFKDGICCCGDYF